MVRASKVLYLAAALGVIAWSLWIPKEDVLDDDCRPRSSLNRLRAEVHGSAFWKAQLAAVDKSIELPDRVRALSQRAESIITAISARTDARLESLYAANPSLPPLSTSRADLLRQQADSIEWTETEDRMNEIMRARASALVRCRPEVVRRSLDG